MNQISGLSKLSVIKQMVHPANRNIGELVPEVRVIKIKIKISVIKNI